MQIHAVDSYSTMQCFFYLREGGNYTVVLTTNQEEHTLRTKDIRLNALKIYEKGKHFYLTLGLKND